MYAEPLGARPMGRSMGSSGDMLPAEEAGGAGDAGGSGAGSFLQAGGPGGAVGPSVDDNAAAAAAAAAVAGMHHSFMTSPQQDCSTSMQLHTPMTGEGLLGGGWGAVEVGARQGQEQESGQGS